MSKSGFDDVAISEICKHAGIANATFYLHFPAKADLATAFGDELSAKLQSQLSEFDGTIIQKLELVRTIVSDEWARNPSILLHILSDTPGILYLPPNTQPARSKPGSIVSAIFQQGQMSGQIRLSLDPDILAQCLIAAWKSILVDQAQSGDQRRAQLAQKQALDVFLYGIVTPTLESSAIRNA